MIRCDVQKTSDSQSATVSLIAACTMKRIQETISRVDYEGNTVSGKATRELPSGGEFEDVSSNGPDAEYGE